MRTIHETRNNQTDQETVLRRLASSVVIQAVADLRSPDFLISLDALCWLIDAGPVWADALGMGITDPDRFFVALVRNGHEKPKLGRSVAQ